MTDRIKKATRHTNQNEGLIFEKSSPGKVAYKLPPLDVPDVDAHKLLGNLERKDLGNMPEVSEIEIIRLIVDGHSTQEIARSIIITENTVKWYVKSIYGKLQVHNRAQLVVQARELGIE